MSQIKVHFWPMDVWLLQHHLLERLTFHHWIVFPILKIIWEDNFSKTICVYCCTSPYYFLYWIPSTVPCTVSTLLITPCGLDYYGYKILELGRLIPLILFFLFEIALAIRVPLYSMFILETVCLYPQNFLLWF